MAATIPEDGAEVYENGSATLNYVIPIMIDPH